MAEAPTNQIGNSSSRVNTGPIDTYDPELATLKRRREAAIKEATERHALNLFMTQNIIKENK